MSQMYALKACFPAVRNEAQMLPHDITGRAELMGHLDGPRVWVQMCPSCPTHGKLKHNLVAINIL